MTQTVPFSWQHTSHCSSGTVTPSGPTFDVEELQLLLALIGPKMTDVGDSLASELRAVLLLCRSDFSNLDLGLTLGGPRLENRKPNFHILDMLITGLILGDIDVNR